VKERVSLKLLWFIYKLLYLFLLLFQLAASCIFCALSLQPSHVGGISNRGSAQSVDPRHKFLVLSLALVCPPFFSHRACNWLSPSWLLAASSKCLFLLYRHRKKKMEVRVLSFIPLQRWATSTRIMHAVPAVGLTFIKNPVSPITINSTWLPHTSTRWSCFRLGSTGRPAFLPSKHSWNPWWHHVFNPTFCFWILQPWLHCQNSPHPHAGTWPGSLGQVRDSSGGWVQLDTVGCHVLLLIYREGLRTSILFLKVSPIGHVKQQLSEHSETNRNVYYNSNMCLEIYVPIQTTLTSPLEPCNLWDQ
jgi:hypothetical protein